MTERIDYVAEVKKSVNREFDDFCANQMNESKESIFNNSYQIYVYTALHDFIDMEVLDELDYKCLYQDKGSILSLLYDEYIEHEDFNVENDMNMDEFFDWYNNNFHKDILEGGAELG